MPGPALDTADKETRKTVCSPGSHGLVCRDTYTAPRWAMTQVSAGCGGVSKGRAVGSLKEVVPKLILKGRGQVRRGGGEEAGGGGEEAGAARERVWHAGGLQAILCCPGRESTNQGWELRRLEREAGRARRHVFLIPKAAGSYQGPLHGGL